MFSVSSISVLPEKKLLNCKSNLKCELKLRVGIKETRTKKKGTGGNEGKNLNKPQSQEKDE